MPVNGLIPIFERLANFRQGWCCRRFGFPIKSDHRKGLCGMYVGKRSRRKLLNPRSLPQQIRSGETVRAILEAAARVLEKVPLGESSTNRIAKVAGVSIGTLYQYFPNKEALAAKLIDLELETEVATYTGIFAEMKDHSTDDLLQRLVDDTADFFMKKRPFLRAIYKYVPQFAKIDTVIAGREVILRLLADEMKRRKTDLKPLDPNVTAFLI